MVTAALFVAAAVIVAAGIFALDFCIDVIKQRLKEENRRQR